MVEVLFDKFNDDRSSQNVWDVSSLDKFMTCPRLYQLGVLEGWQQKKFNPAISWGHAVHAALEHLDQLEVDGLSKEEALPLVLQEVVKDPFNLKESTDSARNVATVARLIIWYVEQFKHDKLKPVVLKQSNLEAAGRSATEVRFEVPIPGTDKRISGRIDKLARLEGDDGVYIVDRKTTKSTLGSWYFADHEPSLQFATYVWALRETLGLPVRGMMVEAFQAAVSFNRIERVTYHISEESVEEHVKNLIYHVQEAERVEAEGYYPQRFSSCHSRGGCRYRNICGMSPSRRDAWLSEDFEKKPYKGSKAE